LWRSRGRDDRRLVGRRRHRDGGASGAHRRLDGHAGDGRIAAIVRLAGVAGSARRGSVTKIITNQQLDAWLEINKITSTEGLRDHVLRTGQALRTGKVSVADANKENRYASAALRRLKVPNQPQGG
jgi:hypothetical protein